MAQRVTRYAWLVGLLAYIGLLLGLGHCAVAQEREQGYVWITLEDYDRPVLAVRGDGTTSAL